MKKQRCHGPHLATHPLKYLIFFLPFLCALYADAQAPTWGWAANSTGGSDAGNAVATDANGNVYVAGTFDNLSFTIGSTTVTNPGIQQMFLVKYTAAGSMAWVVTSAVSSMAAAYGVAVDANNDVYVTGSFDSAITFGNTTLNTGGVYLAKFNTSGLLIWAVAPGGAVGGSSGRDLAVDASGNILMTGTLFNTISFGSTTLPGAGIFTAKYTSTGTVVWAASASTTNFANGRSITTDAAGDVYVIGDFGPSMTVGTNTYTSAGGSDIVVIKYNAAGALQWSDAAGGLNNDYGWGIAPESNGDIYITGHLGPTSTNVVFGATTLSANGTKAKGFLVKYAPGGSVVWATSFGGTVSNTNPRGVAADASGNAYVTGSFHDGPSLTLGTTTLNNVSLAPLYADLFVAKFDLSGNVVWGKSAGGPYVDDAFAIHADAAGVVHVTGWYNSLTLTFDTVSVPNPSTTYDMFVARLGLACTAAPAQPGLITGNSTVCAGSPQTYSVPAVAGAGSYSWTLPAGWTGTSSSNSITATAGAAGGNITVTAVNSCGSSLPRTMTVNVSSAPTTIVTQSGNTLTTAAGFSSYQWYKNSVAIPAATNLSYTATQSGSYYVAVTNSAGCSGQSNTVNVVVSKVHGPKKKELNIYPAVNNGSFVIELPEGVAPSQLRISTINGAAVETQITSAGAGTLRVELASRAPGLYYVELVCPGQVFFRKILIQ